jgi:DNA-binding transcriptional MerR regulator/methylmalonyl-CoA mutase cobalamin-binding subunit
MTSPIPDRGSMRISAVSAVLGIPIPTIRSWERRYGFPAPSRTRGQHRRYSVGEVDLLRALRDEITRGHPAGEAVALVARRAADRERPRPSHLEDVLSATMRLDPTALRRALDAATADLGVDAAIRDVALPAMHEIGSRWAAGTCDVAQEHLATDGVRGWLARLAATAPPPVGGRALVLACGPKDLHSIGVESFAVLLARAGWAVRLLGPLTPTSALVTAVTATRATGAVITSQRGVTRRTAIEAISTVDALRGVTAYYAGDAFATASARRGVPGVYLGTDVVEAVGLVGGARGGASVSARRSA